MSWLDTLAARAAIVNTALEQVMPPGDTYPPVVHQAMRYSLLAGGKRLRAVLAGAAAEAVGGKSEQLLPVACAMEMIHTYSLIHDDLPAMDNDDYRRGKLTCHKVYGEANAILAGDALLTRAFETLSACRERYQASALLQVIEEIAAASGSQGLVGGQVVDLSSEGKLIPVETLKYIHQHKTGALFRVAIRAGAILGGATESQLDLLTSYAQSYGLAFQITDDILDVTADSVQLGKTAGKDQTEQKATYPGLYGLERSRELAGEQVRLAMHTLAPFGSAADFLREAAGYLLKRQA
jgi:geranylgeranyl diphosphate synthase type II